MDYVQIDQFGAISESIACEFWKKGGPVCYIFEPLERTLARTYQYPYPREKELVNTLATLAVDNKFYVLKYYHGLDHEWFVLSPEDV